MDPSLFDKHSASYTDTIDDAVAFGGQEHDFYLQFKARLVSSIARLHYPDLASVPLLDFGCGVGAMTRFLAQDFPNISGFDLSEQSLKVARDRLPNIDFVSAKNGTLPYSDNAFQLVTATCVMHHIIGRDRPSVMAELKRVLKPGGLILILEHNPYNPATRLVVSRCEFDKDAELLTKSMTQRLLAKSGFTIDQTRYFLFAPWDNFVTRAAEWVLQKVPLGAQYVVSAINRK